VRDEHSLARVTEALQVQPIEKRGEHVARYSFCTLRIEHWVTATGAGVRNAHHVAPSGRPILEHEPNAQAPSRHANTGEARGARGAAVDETIHLPAGTNGCLIVIEERSHAFGKNNVYDAHNILL